MINFDDPRLVQKHGSWVRVQVAFYDFLFEVATNRCPTHFNEAARLEYTKQFADGEAFYENAVRAINEAFGSSQCAWEAFILRELEGRP